MTDIDTLDARLEALTARLQLLEDETEIRQLISRYGPTVDTLSAEATADLWTEDGSYEAETYGAWVGRELENMVRHDPVHNEAVAQGCGHVLTAPHIRLDGDTAEAWLYAFHIRFNKYFDSFYIMRLSSNYLKFERTKAGWRISYRTNRKLDGRQEPRDLLLGSVNTPLPSGT